MWTATGSLATARWVHTATRLAGGKVLVTGGSGNTGILANASSELYDPTTGVWTATVPLGPARNQHTATLLVGGKVLVTGGRYGGYLASSELYAP